MVKGVQALLGSDKLCGTQSATLAGSTAFLTYLLAKIGHQFMVRRARDAK